MSRTARRTAMARAVALLLSANRIAAASSAVLMKAAGRFSVMSITWPSAMVVMGGSVLGSSFVVLGWG